LWGSDEERKHFPLLSIGDAEICFSDQPGFDGIFIQTESRATWSWLSDSVDGVFVLELWTQTRNFETSPT
jgi:hypothetical protein